LLAGILVMTALYSINLRIMGRPNIALIGNTTLFTWMDEYSNYLWVPLGILVFMVIAVLFNFLSSRLGLALRATGNNAKMARAQGINDKKMIWLGLSISNALIALAGALYAQIHGFADITMGVGTIIIGLAAVIIGESIFSVRSVLQALFACVLGAVIYRLFIAMALNADGLGLKTSDLNLITAVLVVFAMIIPSLKSKEQKK
jgi:putative ABC transport system permease protein